MTDLERLTEALELRTVASTEDSARRSLAVVELEVIFAAARRYRDLLANPAEPDWEAAYDELGHIESGRVQRAVHAAVGDRLLVDKP